MDVYESIKDLNFQGWGPENWKCVRCKIKFNNFNHWIFHRKVDCPNMTYREKKLVAPDGRYEDTKKNRQCYRCGRRGHYYRRGQCYAFKDDKGEVITWGEPRIPRNIKSPPEKSWETEPGAYFSYSRGIQVHTPSIHTKKGIVHKVMPC